MNEKFSYFGRVIEEEVVYFISEMKYKLTVVVVHSLNRNNCLFDFELVL